MAKNNGNGPKYRVDIYELDGGESWGVEVYVEGEEIVSIERLFITSALDDAINHVMDVYEEEYDSEEDF